MILALTNLAAQVAHLGWLISALMLSFHLRTRVIRAVYHELKPFFLPSAAAVWVVIPTIHHNFGPLDVAMAAVDLFNWWSLRNVDQDDDRWKRRRRKLAERVSLVRGRLAVVPAGAQ